MATGNLLSVYDTDDPFIRNFGEHRDAERKLAITGGLSGFEKMWKDFVDSPGAVYKRIVFDTHGNRGRIFFTHQAMDWGARKVSLENIAIRKFFRNSPKYILVAAMWPMTTMVGFSFRKSPNSCAVPEEA